MSIETMNIFVIISIVLSVYTLIRVGIVMKKIREFGQFLKEVAKELRESA